VSYKVVYNALVYFQSLLTLTANKTSRLTSYHFRNLKSNIYIDVTRLIRHNNLQLSRSKMLVGVCHRTPDSAAKCYQGMSTPTENG